MLTALPLACLLFTANALTLPLSGVPSQKVVSLDKGASTTTMLDLQYGEKRTVTGVRLSEQVKTDTRHRIVLHFANGMIVPVQPARAGDIFIATSYTRTDGVVEKTFPSIARKPEFNLDPRPVVFSTNKVVVSTRDAGGLALPDGSTFSPWSRTDSLVRVEVVTTQGFRSIFNPPGTSHTPVVTLGQETFLQRCVYCHGVNDVGARFGTDVLVGVPLADRYTPKALLTHITTHKLNDYEAGLMMPTQRDVTAVDANALHAYFKALKGVPAKRGSAASGQKPRR